MITTSAGTARPIPTIPAAATSAGLAAVLTAIGTSEPFRDSDVAPDWARGQHSTCRSSSDRPCWSSGSCTACSSGAARHWLDRPSCSPVCRSSH